MVSVFSIQRTLYHLINTNRAKSKRKTRNRRNLNPGYVTGMCVHHLSLMNASSTWFGVRFFQGTMWALGVVKLDIGGKATLESRL